MLKERLTHILLVWLPLGVVVSYATSSAAHAEIGDPIEAGQQAFRDTGPPWYDESSDQLQPVPVPVIGEEPDRARWKPSDRPRWDWNWGVSWLGELFKVLAWVVLLLLIGLLMYVLVQTYLNLAPLRTAAALGTDGGPAFPSDEQRIENLPLTPPSPKGDYLSQARAHYEAGDFAEAIIYLFSYRLLQLDRAGLIRLTKGKTNRQYLLELRRFRELQQLLGQTMAVFEDVFFGQHPLERERFEECWNRNEQFRLLIARSVA